MKELYQIIIAHSTRPMDWDAQAKDKIESISASNLHKAIVLLATDVAFRDKLLETKTVTGQQLSDVDAVFALVSGFYEGVADTGSAGCKLAKELWRKV